MAGNFVVLGAGPSGLACAWKLSGEGRSVTVLEKREGVGGVSSCFRHGDFKLDYGPHKIYTQNAPVLDETRRLLSGELLTIPKKSRIRLKGKYFNFPVSIAELLFKLSPVTMAKCGADYALANAAGMVSGPSEKSYEDYLVSRFGRGLYELVFGPYARKVWGNPKFLAASLAKSRVSVPNLFEMFSRAVLGDRGKPEISAKEFYYPKHGVCRLSERMNEEFGKNGGKMLLESAPEKILVRGNRVASVSFGKKSLEVGDGSLVSTIPILALLELIDPKPPESVLAAARGLKHRDLVLAYVVFEKNRLFDDNWLFFPEEEFVFNRIFEQKSFSPEMVPEGKTVLCAEITCPPKAGFWNAPDDELEKRVLSDLEKAGIAKASEATEFFTKRVENGYPVYDVDYQKNLATVLSYLNGIDNIYSIGRQGLFMYVGMMDCHDTGFATAEHIKAARPRQAWGAALERFQNYQTLD